MNQLSSHMASVFHYTTQPPIQSLRCQFDLPVAKPAWHVCLPSCFYPTCRLLTNLVCCCISEVCFHCRIALDALTDFDCNSKCFFPTAFPFPVKLSSFHCFLNLTFPSNASIWFCFQDFCTIWYQLCLCVPSHLLQCPSADCFFTSVLNFLSSMKLLSFLLNLSQITFV